MKKIALMILILLCMAGVLYAQAVQNNVLWNEPFISATAVPGGTNYSYNTHWKGFTDGSDTGDITFFRKITPVLNAPSVAETCFKRDYEHRKGIASVSISTLTMGADPLVLELYKPGYEYEVGFSMLCDNLYFDQHLCQYGLTVRMEWFDAARNLIKTDIERANLDTGIIAKTGVANATTKNQWLRYRNKVSAPVNAKYFTYSIIADSGVYTDFGDKVYLDDPVMIKCDSKFYTVALDNFHVGDLGAHNIYNNVILSNVESINFKALINKAKLTELSEQFNVENIKIKAKVYAPTAPDVVFNIPVTESERNFTAAQPYIKFNVNTSSLSRLKYVFETEMTYNAPGAKSVVIGREKTYFTVGNENNYLGYGYEPGVNKAGKALKVDSVATFFIGLVDRGVNFGSTSLDSEGKLKGFNKAPGTDYGADLIGNNYEFVKVNPTTGYPAYVDVADYLNLVAVNSEAKGYFSYSEFNKFGLNAVYPAYLARLPLISKNFNFVSALKAICDYSDTNIIMPLAEFTDKKFTRELQYKMNYERALFGYSPQGAGNAFTSMVKAAAGLNGVVAYMTGENISLFDTAELKDKKAQILRMDNTKPVAVTIDLDSIEFDSATNEFIFPEDVNKFANILFINVKPRGVCWADGEFEAKAEKIQKLLFGNSAREIISNYSVFLNVSFAKKENGSTPEVQKISDLVNIYRVSKNYVNMGGIFFDNVGSMTVDPEDGTGEPDFHYNLFRLFLSEKDTENYSAPSDYTDETTLNYIYDNIRVNTHSLDRVFPEIHVKKVGEDLYDCYFYCNNTESTAKNLDFTASRYFTLAYSPNISWTGSETDFTASQSVQFTETENIANCVVLPNNITKFTISLHYVPYPPFVTITSDKNEIYVGDTLQMGYTVEGEPITDPVWSSENPEIATIDSNGLVTGVSEGIATIKLSYKWNESDYSVTKTVYVDNVVSFNCPDTVILGEVNDASISGGNIGYVSEIHWAVSDEDILELTSAPVLDHEIVQFKGIKGGKADIQVSYKFNEKTYTMSKEVSVLVPPAVKIIPETDVSVVADETVQLSYSADRDELTDKVWSSENEDTATVDQTGLVTGVAKGTATIKFAYKWNGKDYSVTKNITVTVEAPAVTITPEEEINIAGGPDTSVPLGYKVSGGKEITDVKWSSDWYALKVDQTGLVTAKEGCSGVYNVTLSYKYKGEEYSVTKDIGAFVVAVKMPSFTSYSQTKQTLLVEYNNSMGPMIRNGGVHILTPDTIVQSGTSGPYSIFVNIVGEGKEAATFTFDLTNANGEFPGRHIDFKGLESYGEAQIEFTPTISPESLTAKVGENTPIEVNITRGGLECEIKSVTAEDPSVVTVWGTTLFKGNKVGDTNFIVTYKPKNVDKEFTATIPVHITE